MNKEIGCGKEFDLICSFDCENWLCGDYCPDCKKEHLCSDCQKLQSQQKSGGKIVVNTPYAECEPRTASVTVDSSADIKNLHTVSESRPTVSESRPNTVQTKFIERKGDYKTVDIQQVIEDDNQGIMSQEIKSLASAEQKSEQELTDKSSIGGFLNSPVSDFEKDSLPRTEWHIGTERKIVKLNLHCEICNKEIFIEDGTVFPDKRLLHFECYKKEIENLTKQKIIEKIKELKNDPILDQINLYDEQIKGKLFEKIDGLLNSLKDKKNKKGWGRSY